MTGKLPYMFYILDHIGTHIGKISDQNSVKIKVV